MRRHRVCDQCLAAPKVKQHAPLRPCRRVESSVPLRQYGPTERCLLRCNPATDAQLTGDGVSLPHGQDPKELIPLRDCVRNFHAKFWEMTDDYREYCIPYEKVIPALMEAGYNATLSSEYEGQRAIQDIGDVDEVEQVRRHHVMLRKLLGA